MESEELLWVELRRMKNEIEKWSLEMEEEKAAAYYDELARKGEGAARFKQGLGFSSSAPNDDVPKPSSSYLSKFVKASSESEKQAQLQSIHDKLKKKPSSESRVSSSDRSRSREKRRKRSRSGDRYRETRRRSRSRERHRDSERGRRRSRSVSPRKQRRSEKDANYRGKVSETKKGKNAEIDYSKLIQGYDRMVRSTLLISLFFLFSSLGRWRWCFNVMP